MITFGADGSFSIDFQNFTWIESWQSGDNTQDGYCGITADANGLGINPDGEFSHEASLPSQDGLNGVTDAELTLYGVEHTLAYPSL